MSSFDKLIVYSIIGVFCAAWAYSVAQFKNRDGTGWAVLTFFFPVIGLIATYLQPTIPPRRFRRPARARRVRLPRISFERVSDV